MKMRLKPLRGQTYGTWRGPVVFIEVMESGLAKVHNGSTFTMAMEDLNLPIIDTKDYEKIENEKTKTH